MEKRWLKSYDQGVPETLEPYPDKTLIDYLDDACRENPDKTMLIFMGRKISYIEVQRLSDCFAAALVSKGIKKGDRVALVMPNCPQAVICRWGIWKVGALAVHINPAYTEAEMENALNDCEAETVVVLSAFYRMVKSIQKRTMVRMIICTSIKDYLPPTLKLLFTLFREKKDGHYVVINKDDMWLSDLLKEYKNGHRPDIEIRPEDHALILFSGGTTGIPKGVIGTHASQVITGLQFYAWFKKHVVPYRDVVSAVLPFFHSFGTYAVLCTSVVAHLPISLVPDPRNRNDVIKSIQRDRPVFFPAVPAMFIALLEHPAVKAGKVDFKSMKMCVSGAAPLLAETKKRFEELTGGRIVEGYGLTESTMAAIVQPYEGTYKEGSIGLPLPDVVVRIGDIETGEGDLAAGSEGEIIMKAPQLMVGYYKRPEETAEMLRGGWLHTGDVGYMDDDGYVFVTSRKKDLIKTSGFQVWPREVEEVISMHPAVAEVSVAGIPDAKQGEAVKAWIVLAEGKQATEEEIRQWCRQRLTSYKVPRYIEFRQSLPKTMVGKILRRVLQEEEQNRK